MHIWHIPEKGLESNISKPEYSLPQFDKRVENVVFHPTTEFILSVAYYDTIKLWDILHQREIACKYLRNICNIAVFVNFSAFFL